MIGRFRHRGLERYFRHDDRRGLPANAERIGRLLDVLDAATRPDALNLPGFRFHRLKGQRADTYSVTVSGNVRITFRFDGEDAVDVDLEDYH